MSNELMTTNSGGMNVMSRIGEFQQAAKLFYESGMFSDTKSAAQCFVKIMAGAELGIPPFTAMNAFHVIQGRPVMTANTIAARLKASGKYNYRITEKTGERCAIDFFEGKDKVHTEVWDTKRAQKAGVKNMDKYPEAMLFARAVTAGARAIAPDVVGQFYTPDELGAEVDADGVIVSAPSPHAPPEPVKPEANANHAPDSIEDQIAKLIEWHAKDGRVYEKNLKWANGLVDKIAAAKSITLNQGDTAQGRMDALVAHLKAQQPVIEPAQ